MLPADHTERKADVGDCAYVASVLPLRAWQQKPSFDDGLFDQYWWGYTCKMKDVMQLQRLMVASNSRKTMRANHRVAYCGINQSKLETEARDWW